MNFFVLVVDDGIPGKLFEVADYSNAIDTISNLVGKDVSKEMEYDTIFDDNGTMYYILQPE